VDLVKKKFCAIKEKSFDNTDKTSVINSAREAMLLAKLDHVCIPKLFGLYTCDGNLNLVMAPFMEKDVEYVWFQTEEKITNSHVQLTMLKVFDFLAYIHSANLVHRMLSPDSLLVDFKTKEFYVCNLSSMRSIREPTYSPLGDVAAHQWRYFAPELLNEDGDSKINPRRLPAVDMWAAGCIFAEMLAKAQRQNQNSVRLFSGSKKQIAESAKEFQKLLKSKELLEKPGSIFVSALSPEEHELLEELFESDPAARISARAALSKPYFPKKSGKHISQKVCTVESDELLDDKVVKFLRTECSHIFLDLSE